MKAKIGDIIEIETPKGLAYAIYTHRYIHPPRYGALIRVFEKLYTTRPIDLAEVIRDQIRFTLFYPLQTALNKKIVAVIGNLPVPDHISAFPLFRAAGLVNPATNHVDDWWLWDGEKEWRIGALTHEQKKLPIRAVWNHTFLIDRIVQGWRPETDQR